MRLELKNISNEVVNFYNIEQPLNASEKVKIYDSLYLNPLINSFYKEYSINELEILILNNKLRVIWNDYQLDSFYSIERLKYEFDFYTKNIATDKYEFSDFLRIKRQIFISYLQASGSNIQMVRDLLDRYNTEIQLYIQGGMSDLQIAIENEDVQPFLTYLNTVVGVIPYTGDLETVKDSILRNIK
jgi:hypothetical protein